MCVCTIYLFLFCISSLVNTYASAYAFVTKIKPPKHFFPDDDALNDFLFCVVLNRYFCIEYDIFVRINKKQILVKGRFRFRNVGNCFVVFLYMTYFVLHLYTENNMLASSRIKIVS